MQQSIDVGRWENFLERQTGVCLSARSAHVGSAVRRRMGALNVREEEAYWAQMNDARSSLEWSLLIDELVVKDTRFFRHRVSYEYLREYINRRLNDKNVASLFSIWSVGCSTGEEAWSLAMVANDAFNLAVEHDGFFAVQGTDVSLGAIAVARRALYSAQKVMDMTDFEKKKYLSQRGERFEVAPSLQSRVAFNVGNVLEMRDDGLRHDVIYCQNLLIYFRKWRRRRALDSLVSRLNIGGVLIIGPGEMSRWDHPKLKKIDRQGVAAYQKIAE